MILDAMTVSMEKVKIYGALFSIFLDLDPVPALFDFGKAPGGSFPEEQGSDVIRWRPQVL